jgi:hypothetical protein
MNISKGSDPSSMLTISVFGSGTGSAWIRIEVDWLHRIRIPMGKNDTQKKSEEMHCFEVLDVLFWVLLGSPVAWTSFMEAM